MADVPQAQGTAKEGPGAGAGAGAAGEAEAEAGPPPHWSVRLWRDYLKPILVVVIVLTAFRSSISDWNDVPTGSMKPSIIEGDRIYVNKLAYDLKVPYTKWRLWRWGEPKRGEVVVFFSPEGGTRMVKRVVGVPGDTLQVVNNRLMINGKLTEFEAGDPAWDKELPAHEQGMYRMHSEVLDGRRHPVMTFPAPLGRAGGASGDPRYFGPIKLGPDQFFMMGDNRDNSRDSRFYGPVHRDQIMGRSSRVILSLDPKNYYMPRWSRFFKALP